MLRTRFLPAFAALTLVAAPAFATTTPAKPMAAKPMAAKPAPAKSSGKMATAKLANGKTVTYDCSKPGNKTKAACK